MPPAFDSERAFVQWVEHLIDLDMNALGHNEDAVAIMTSTEEYMVINTDGWVASTDLPPGVSLFQAGYRAVANALSDVIAKGAKPEAMIISISISDIFQEHLQNLLGGISQASRDFSTAYLGGDMNSSSDLVIDVTAWGRTDKLLRRSGAQPGDIVYWLGPALGSTAAALGVLTKHWQGDRDKAIEVMGHPSLFFEFLGTQATSSTDSSDGLAKSLHQLSEASGVAIKLNDLEAISQSLPHWIRAVSDINHVPLSDLFLYGGEELAVVFTASSNVKVPEGTLTLGKVVEGSGVWFDNIKIADHGWDHFA